MHHRVIGEIGPVVGEDWGEAVLHTIRPQVLDTLVRIQLVVPIDPEPPAQYAILNAAAGPSTIFTFNLDGLAWHHCRHRHRILEPHGRVERELFEDEEYMELLPELLAFDIGAGHLRPKLLMEPEPEEILRTRAYRAGESLLARARSVVFVGYSFARFEHGHDDAASLHYFGELLQRYPKEVLVVDPFPDEVADMLSHAAGRSLALPVRARWDLLSEVIMAELRRGGYRRVSGRSVQAAKVLGSYRQLSE